MKKFSDVLYWIIGISPLVLAIMLIFCLPEQIPGHYSLGGEVDRWGSKYEIFFMPIITVLTQILFYNISNREKEVAKKKVYSYAGKGITLLFSLLSYIYVYGFENIKNIVIKNIPGCFSVNPLTQKN